MDITAVKKIKYAKWCCILLSIIFCMLTWIIGTYFSRHQALETLDHELNQLNFTVNKKFIRYNARLAQKLAEMPLVIDKCSDQAPTSPALFQFIQGVKTGVNSTLVYLMDISGIVIASTPLDSDKTLVGKNYGYRPYFIRALKGVPAIYSAIGAITGKRGLYFSHPVYDNHRKSIIGVVVIKQNLEYLDKNFQNLHSPCALVSPEGVIFACNEKNYLFQTVFPLTDADRKKLIQSRQFADKKLKASDLLIHTSKSIPVNTNVYLAIKKIDLEGWFLLAWQKKSYPYPEIAGISVWGIIMIICLDFWYSAKIRRNIAENAEAEERKKAQFYLDIAKTIILALDTKGNVILINRSGCKLLGKERCEIVGKNWFTNFLPEDIREEAERTFNTIIYRGILDDGYLESEVEVADGSRRLIGWNCSVITNSNRKVIEILRSGEDLTKRRQMEIEGHHKQKLESVGRLAAGIAHEINTPIQFINDNLKFMNESFHELLVLPDYYSELIHKLRNSRAISPEKNNVYEKVLEELDITFIKKEVPMAIEQVKSGIHHITGIVSAMKEFSSTESGDSMTLVDVNHAIKTTITIASNEWKYVAEINCNLSPRIPEVLCFAGELNQVILNLIMNAKDAIVNAQSHDNELKGTITISTDSDEKWIIIKITDNGNGISPKIQQKIYDPFFTTKDVGTGTGQGLTIARLCIEEKHNGRLTFTTREKNGTTFTIQLPIHQAVDRKNYKYKSTTEHNKHII